MILVQRNQVPSQQSLAFSASFFTGVVAGTDDYSLRRWNCGEVRAARHCRSLDVSLEQFSAGQVVCGTADGSPIARRWEKKPTRKCGQRVGAEAALLENDPLSMVSEGGARETGRLFTELEAGALETDRPSTELEASASVVRASVSRRRVSGAGASQRGRLVLGFGLLVDGCVLNAVFSAPRRVQTVLITLLLHLIHARVMSRALIVSMSSCMSNSHRIHIHIIHIVQLHVPCMVCMLHDVFRIHRIRWEMDGVSAYLGNQSH